MTVQFSFTGPLGETVPYTTVTVTLTNSVGASIPPRRLVLSVKAEALSPSLSRGRVRWSVP